MEMQNKSKAPIIIGVIAAVAAVCLGVFAVKFFFFDAPKRTAKNYVKAYEAVIKDPSDKNLKKYVKYMSQIDAEQNLGVDLSDDEDDAVDKLEEMYDKKEKDDDDDDYKVTKVKVISCTKFTKDELDNFKDIIDDKEMEYIEGDDIKAAYHTIVLVETKNDDGEYDVDTDSFTVIKEKGKWKVSESNWRYRARQKDKDDDED